MDLRYFIRPEPVLSRERNARAAWRHLTEADRARLRDQARTTYPILAAMPDRSWILTQICLYLLNHPEPHAQDFPLFDRGGPEVGRAHDHPAA
jgi:hypothetical protein